MKSKWSKARSSRLANRKWETNVERGSRTERIHYWSLAYKINSLQESQQQTLTVVFALSSSARAHDSLPTEAEQVVVDIAQKGANFPMQQVISPAIAQTRDFP